MSSSAGVRIGYYAQESEKTLDECNSVLEEVESVADTRDIPRLRNLLGSFLFQGDDVMKKVQVLSGGEKSRLALLKILLHPANLLLLDEPTNHLDINSKDMLLEAIKAYDGTVVFVSHDTHFIKNLATRILYLSDDEEPQFFEGDYDYFSYKLEEKEKAFLLKREDDKRQGGDTPSPVKANAQDHRQQKERRNRIQKLERESDSLMEEIARAQARLEALDASMADEAVYTDAERMRQVVREKEDVAGRIDQMNERWFEISTMLEELSDGQDA